MLQLPTKIRVSIYVYVRPMTDLLTPSYRKMLSTTLKLLTATRVTNAWVSVCCWINFLWCWRLDLSVWFSYIRFKKHSWTLIFSFPFRVSGISTHSASSFLINFYFSFSGLTTNLFSAYLCSEVRGIMTAPDSVVKFRGHKPLFLFYNISEHLLGFLITNSQGKLMTRFVNSTRFFLLEWFL